MKKLIACLAISAATSFFNPVIAKQVDVEITNLTQNIVFTPLLVSAHDSEFHFFRIGEGASAELQAMAEGGALDGLVTQAEMAGANNLVNLAEGPLAASMSASQMHFEINDHMYLSLVAMLLPTNDGFVGLDSWKIPESPGTYTLWLNAYDAGTEANNELIAADGGMPGTPGIPDAPLFEHGANGSGVTTQIPNQNVHIHPGNVGDGAEDGGASDLDSRVHRWLNPVAKLVVTVH